MRTPLIRTLTLAAFGLAAASCAGPKFYTIDADGHDHETGVPIYPTRTFLVVASTGKKDAPVQVTVVRLPDRSGPPIYAREVRGWGSGELTLEFEGGVLKSVGGKSDAQSASAIDALGSLVSAAADVEKALRAQGPEGEPAFRLYEVVMSPDRTELREVLPSSIRP
jgi:hypothetical protein